MFDIGWSEMLVIAAVAVVVIGPKDLPRVMRTVGQFTTRVRGMAREFQNSMDEMARQADIDDMRKQMASIQNDVTTSVNSALDPAATRPDYLPTPDDLMKDLAVNGPPPVVQPAAATVAAAPAAVPPATPDPDAPAVIPAGGDAVAAAAGAAAEAPARRSEG